MNSELLITLHADPSVPVLLRRIIWRQFCYVVSVVLELIIVQLVFNKPNLGFYCMASFYKAVLISFYCQSVIISNSVIRKSITKYIVNTSHGRNDS